MKKKIFTYILLLALIEIFLVNYTQLFFPNANMVMEISDAGELKNAWLCEQDGVQEVRFSKTTSNIWNGHISNRYFNLDEDVEIDLSKETARCTGSGYPIKYVPLDNFTNNSMYQNIRVIVIYSNLFKQISAFLICNLGLLLIACRIKKYKINVGSIFENFIYSSAAFKEIGMKTVLVTILVSAATIILKPGCDYEVIAQTAAINLSGIDVYQVHDIVERFIYDVEFLAYPYFPVMTIFYSLAGIFSFGYSPFYLHTPFEVLAAICLKIVNMGLINALVLGILGFMSEHNLIQSKNIRKAYLWSVFNPLVFYIAILYIQLDLFPIYCVCIGLLLFAKEEFEPYTGIIAAVLLSAGVSAKLQNILMLPTIVLFLFMAVIKKKEKVSYALFFFALVGLNFFNIYISNSVIGSFVGAARQGQRIWYSVFTFAPEVCLFLTIFVIMLYFLINSFLYSSKIHLKYLACNSMFMLGGIILIFSASMISTPSTLIISFPAFVLCMALEDDWVKRMIIASFSILCVMDVMLTSIGDITASLNYVGKVGIFTQIERQLGNSPEKVKWISILITVSKAGMVAYAALFHKYGTKMLSQKE